MLLEKAKAMMLARVVCLVAVALFAIGCFRVTGGGWLTSAIPPGKATFAFHGSCDPETGVASGKLEYHDHAADVHLHGVVSNLDVPGCIPIDVPFAIYAGTYTPQPKKLGPGGTFFIAVQDLGEPGPSSGDAISIALEGGVYDGYEHFGTIEGGNIQAH